MITSLYISGVFNGYATSIELDDLNYPLQLFDWDYETDGDNFPKTNSPGSWKTRKKVTQMTISMNGEILADSTSSRWTKTKALKQMVIPPPSYPDTYDVTRFALTMDGDGTTYYAYCVLDDNNGALETTGAPSIGEFQTTFECREGYWMAGLGGPMVVI